MDVHAEVDLPPRINGLVRHEVSDSVADVGDHVRAEAAGGEQEPTAVVRAEVASAALVLRGTHVVRGAVDATITCDAMQQKLGPASKGKTSHGSRRSRGGASSSARA